MTKINLIWLLSSSTKNTGL